MNDLSYVIKWIQVSVYDPLSLIMILLTCIGIAVDFVYVSV